MSTLTVEIPDSLRLRVEELAARDGYSIKQFAASAIAEKYSVMTSLDHIRREAAAGRQEDFDAFLAASPDVPPFPGDEL